MKTKLFTLIVALALAGCAAVASGADLPKFPASAYSPLPGNYKAIAKRYLDYKLFDPYSAKIEWVGKPLRSSFQTAQGWVPAWSVCMFVNAKNRFGAYVGMKLMFIEIRNGQVIGSLGLEHFYIP
jgi:hypothetical protein